MIFLSSLGLLMWFVLCPWTARGQELLFDSGGNPKQFMIVLSGSAGAERFDGVRELLILDKPAPLSLNTYLAIVKGYPQTNCHNCFFWLSEDTVMTDISSEIVCDIKRTYLKQPDVHFFFLSPTLLENKSAFLTQREKERRKMAEAMALPTKIYAKAGKLSLRILGDHVSGTVWMKGYDSVEHAYVHYHASFSGEKILPIEPKKEFKK
jgi:hypothetical protein